jgi:peptide/nickel transport system ATP-binding protein
VAGVVIERERFALEPTSWFLPPGEIHGWVGESGAGKTTLARVLAGLERPVCGQLRLDGRDAWAPRPSRTFRRAVQYLPQDPAATLDPRWTVGAAIEEALRASGVAERATDLLERVGLEPSLADRRPRALSGGQRQRAGWARMLAMAPRYLILDEPLTALDPPRVRVLERLIRAQRDAGAGVLLVSHDLDAILRRASRVGVMWRGRMVERGEADALTRAPRHPYTARLLQSRPGFAPQGALE